LYSRIETGTVSVGSFKKERKMVNAGYAFSIGRKATHKALSVSVRSKKKEKW
jgi:hypothetical protein